MAAYFDASALRARYDAALPYDPLRERHVLDASVPRPEITNLVYEVQYFTDPDTSPALFDRWRLAGAAMGDCLAHNDRDAHYVVRVLMPDGYQVCSILMHPATCIVSGAKSIVDLVTVCNTLTRLVRTRFALHGASFYVGSFVGKLHNTVVRLTLDGLPVNFARIEPLLRPQNAVRRSDEAIGHAAVSPFNATAQVSSHIPHFTMSINVPPNPRKKKNKKPMLKMYEHRVGPVVFAKVCLNGIPSIDMARAILLEFYFLIVEHRAEVLYTRAELLKNAALRETSEPLPVTGPPLKKRHNIE